jgi:transposase
MSFRPQDIPLPDGIDTKRYQRDERGRIRKISPMRQPDYQPPNKPRRDQPQPGRAPRLER